jgi:hypothetical protein
MEVKIISSLTSLLDTVAGKIKLRLAASYAVAAAARIVDLVHKAVGRPGIREQHHFQRYFRNLHTIEHHAYISAGRCESGGQYFLGVPIDWLFYGLQCASERRLPAIDRTLFSHDRAWTALD